MFTEGHSDLDSQPGRNMHLYFFIVIVSSCWHYSCKWTQHQIGFDLLRPTWNISSWIVGSGRGNSKLLRMNSEYWSMLLKLKTCRRDTPKPNAVYTWLKKKHLTNWWLHSMVCKFLCLQQGWEDALVTVWLTFLCGSSSIWYGQPVSFSQCSAPSWQPNETTTTRMCFLVRSSY